MKFLVLIILFLITKQVFAQTPCFTLQPTPNVSPTPTNTFGTGPLVAIAIKTKTPTLPPTQTPTQTPIQPCATPYCPSADIADPSDCCVTIRDFNVLNSEYLSCVPTKTPTP